MLRFRGKDANAILGIACQDAACLAAICDLELRFRGQGCNLGNCVAKTLRFCVCVWKATKAGGGSLASTKIATAASKYAHIQSACAGFFLVLQSGRLLTGLSRESPNPPKVPQQSLVHGQHGVDLSFFSCFVWLHMGPLLSSPSFY